MIEIRAARKEDLEGILALNAILTPNDLPMDTERLKSAWETVMANPDRYLYVVADEDGKISASCNVAIIPNLTRSARPYAVIENVITHPDARRKGLGRKVMEKAMAFAGMHNCYKVMLLSGSHRLEAHAFYESLGFSGSKKKGFVIEYLDEKH